MTKLIDYYAGDLPRGDAYPVRYDRLNMLTPHPSLVWVLCWAMEAAFAVALYRPTSRRVAVPAFWIAYLIVLHVSIRGGW